MKHEFEEIRAAIELDRTGAFSHIRLLHVTLSSSLFLVAANVGWKSLISTPGNRRTYENHRRHCILLPVVRQWLGVVLLESDPDRH